MTIAGELLRAIAQRRLLEVRSAKEMRTIRNDAEERQQQILKDNSELRMKLANAQQENEVLSDQLRRALNRVAELSGATGGDDESD